MMICCGFWDAAIASSFPSCLAEIAVSTEMAVFPLADGCHVPRSTTCYREARPLSANSSFCVAYVEPPLRSFELSEKEACLTECGILESTEPPLNLVESSQRSSLSERVRPFAKTLGLFQLTGAARPLSFFMVAQGLLFLFPGERIT